jgi:glutaredoxin 3
VKEFLSQRAIQYTERDIVSDPSAIEELAELGYMTTPVIKIDGEVVVGFNQRRLLELLT